MKRAAILALALIATPGLAQEVPKPRTDVEELRKEAKADPAIAAALADKTRSTESRLRDSGRMVELILGAADAKPGMRVLDVASGGGYLALLFSSLVGETGHVDIHNTPGWINQFPGMDPDVQKRRITRRNVGWITEPWNGIAGEPGTYDLIVMGQVYHDALLEGADIVKMNRRIFDLLKPGGRLVIEDHDAIDAQPPAQQANLHRISHELVTELFAEAGLRLHEMTLNDSKFDDRRMNVFFPGVRGRTDRFIAVFLKPQHE